MGTVEGAEGGEIAARRWRKSVYIPDKAAAPEALSQVYASTEYVKRSDESKGADPGREISSRGAERVVEWSKETRPEGSGGCRPVLQAAVRSTRLGDVNCGGDCFGCKV